MLSYGDEGEGCLEGRIERRGRLLGPGSRDSESGLAVAWITWIYVSPASAYAVRRTYSVLLRYAAAFKLPTANSQP